MNGLIKLKKEIEKITIDEEFSGTVLVSKNQEVLLSRSGGFADKAEKRLNNAQTRFAIASGCKLFTALAVSQLVERGVISFHSKLKDCLDIEFPHWDEDVTIHHLLTHSSGIPDYFDEDTMSNYEDLWKQTPMYLLQQPADFLPLFQEKQMKFSPGERFHYNNAGFIVLGLIVEQHSGLAFTEYVNEYIFKKAEMNDSGYFSMDSLPKNTAFGYVKQEDAGYKTNFYSVPVKGGADGGAYITAPDMVRFWEALLENRLLTSEYTNKLLSPHVNVKEGVNYGYGIWINSREGSVTKYHVMGYDPGVSFHSAYYPTEKVVCAIASNESSGAYGVLKNLEVTLNEES